jgi:ribose 5-phosphate isomerase B
MNREELKSIIREVLQKSLEGPAPAPGSARPQVSGSGSATDLVTEECVMAARTGGRVIFTTPDAVITPLARETADRYGVAIEVAKAPAPDDQPPAPGPEVAGVAPTGVETIAIGSDHGGFELKENLKRFLEEESGYPVIDFGTDSAEAVDYPDFAHRVAAAVSRGEAWRGIIVDGVGVGSAMVANRHPGVRAAALAGIVEVVNAREHNDANVLCLGGRMIGDLLARALTVTFLNTVFAGGRHAVRVNKIEAS